VWIKLFARAALDKFRLSAYILWELERKLLEYSMKHYEANLASSEPVVPIWEPAMSVREFCAYWRITPKTFQAWERKGVAPRRARTGTHQRRLAIRLRELSAWRAQVEADKLRLANPHLKHPAEPLSWVRDAIERANQ
jgi:hypothetical protein